MIQAGMCFGRNQYKNYPDDWLGGCVQDAEDMRQFFIDHLNLNDGNSSVLLDQDCTKVNMLHGLGLLTENAPRLQRAFFSDSGHGTTVQSNETDGLSGALCCYDLRETAAGDYDPTTLFLEDDFRRALAAVPSTCLLEAFLDACFVGEFAEKAVKGLRMAYRVRSLPPRHKTISHPAARLLEDRGGQNTVIWSACQSFQTSAEAYLGGKSRGAFTYLFLREYKADMPRGELLKKVKLALWTNGYSQIPALDCSDRLRALPVGEM